VSELPTPLFDSGIEYNSFTPLQPPMAFLADSPMDLTQDSYDRFAAAYTERYFDTRGLDEEMDRFRSCLPSSPQILDAGCGPGHLLRYLARNHAACVGVDYSLPMLTEGRRRDPRLPLVAGNLLALPFPNDSFDGIWARASLIHLNATDHRECLREFYRTLKPKGIVYAAVRRGEGETHRRETQQGVPIARYFRFWEPEQWHNEFASAGFELFEQGIEKGEPEDWLWVHARKRESKSDFGS
jgi:SAM-dependent methyltransferase